ncbi:MAG: HAD-IA family hydrolase [Nitrososphaerota archaeon]|nr:HAD-IA family hydrolase [Nitrososphaerota archaeon]MDG6966287.1 HAD-IA family hydrolase [Nitrososphaerota archaeon]MDG6977722.1 HAD-IA family hydrolase [Nitrososphaerota archaeon]
MKLESAGGLEFGSDRGYVRPSSSGGLVLRRAAVGALSRVDAVAFDCDGVLIDARKSYDETIRVVVERMVEGFSGTGLTLTKAAPALISMVRRTGGFNSDWDTSYALTLFSVVALDGEPKSRARALGALREIASSFGSAPRARGKEAVDSFLEERFPSLKGRLDGAREYLGYPTAPPEGRLTTAFDELYFGGELFRKIHGFPASKPRAKGLIELERPLVSIGTLDSLVKSLGGHRLALVTGRPRVGTEYSLGEKVMGYFDGRASMFIGDADIDLSLRRRYDAYRKPSPDALVRAKDTLSSETILYVGDSAEDLRMAKGARSRGLRGYLFAGVYETSAMRSDQARFFRREEADMVIQSVNRVPSGLLLAKNGAGARR